MQLTKLRPLRRERKTVKNQIAAYNSKVRALEDVKKSLQERRRALEEDKKALQARERQLEKDDTSLKDEQGNIQKLKNEEEAKLPRLDEAVIRGENLVKQFQTPGFKIISGPRELSDEQLASLESNEFTVTRLQNYLHRRFDQDFDQGEPGKNGC
jgi:chromosome segregation ATPase